MSIVYLLGSVSRPCPFAFRGTVRISRTSFCRTAAAICPATAQLSTSYCPASTLWGSFRVHSSGVSSSHSASRPLVPSPIFATTACRMSGARAFATATSYTSRTGAHSSGAGPRFTRSTHLPSTFPDNTSSTVPHWTAVPDTLAVGLLRHAMWSLPAIENVTPWIVPSTSPLAPPPVRASPTLSIRAVARSSSAVLRFAISMMVAFDTKRSMSVDSRWRHSISNVVPPARTIFSGPIAWRRHAMSVLNSRSMRFGTAMFPLATGFFRSSGVRQATASCSALSRSRAGFQPSRSPVGARRPGDVIMGRAARLGSMVGVLPLARSRRIIRQLAVGDRRADGWMASILMRLATRVSFRILKECNARHLLEPPAGTTGDGPVFVSMAMKTAMRSGISS